MIVLNEPDLALIFDDIPFSSTARYQGQVRISGSGNEDGWYKDNSLTVKSRYFEGVTTYAVNGLEFSISEGGRHFRVGEKTWKIGNGKSTIILFEKDVAREATDAEYKEYSSLAFRRRVALVG